MDGLIEGRIVHYVIPNGEHRRADVIKVWNQDGVVNLNVTTDYGNDVTIFQNHQTQYHPFPPEFLEKVLHGHFQATSVRFDETGLLPGTWHWIEKA